MDEDRPENALVNLVVNIIIPAVIMIKFSSSEYFGPVIGLIVALAFPLVYGVYDLLTRKKVNFISVLGVVSILLTGGISLLRFDPKWIAIKEAAVPLIIGIAVLVSLRTKYPFLQMLFYKVIDKKRVLAAIKRKKRMNQFRKRIEVSSYIFAFSFFVSAVLNYVLAKIILKSPPGSEQYTAELGRMTALSFPIIAVPSMIIGAVALFYLSIGTRDLTDLELEEIFKNP